MLVIVRGQESKFITSLSGQSHVCFKFFQVFRVVYFLMLHLVLQRGMLLTM